MKKDTIQMKVILQEQQMYWKEIIEPNLVPLLEKYGYDKLTIQLMFQQDPEYYNIVKSLLSNKFTYEKIAEEIILKEELY